MDKSGIQTPQSALALLSLLPTSGPHGTVAQVWYLHRFPRSRVKTPSKETRAHPAAEHQPRACAAAGCFHYRRR